jgi:hypothetical protein
VQNDSLPTSRKRSSIDFADSAQLRNTNYGWLIIRTPSQNASLIKEELYKLLIRLVSFCGIANSFIMTFPMMVVHTHTEKRLRATTALVLQWLALH